MPAPAPLRPTGEKFLQAENLSDEALLRSVQTGNAPAAEVPSGRKMSWGLSWDGQPQSRGRGCVCHSLMTPLPLSSVLRGPEE